MIVFDHPLGAERTWPQHADLSILGGALRVDLDALGAIGCCLVLLSWWAYRQCQARCADCGYCPIWCQCEHDDANRQRPSH